MDMGKTPKVLCVGGMSAQEILIGTPILRKYLQNSIVLTKNHQMVEYQQRCCFKGPAQDVTKNTNPDLNIMSETKNVGTLAMGRYLWTKVC